MNSNQYKYDIAITLCKQDVEYAKQLVSILNPSLNVFFYEYKQEELITQNGAEKFAQVFKEEARLIILLYRNDWSESYYTDIEKNAIIDRTSIKNQGYSFLFVIPMENNQTPSWYPNTKIYADPKRFSIEQMATFIEFKLNDLGLNIKKITVEERYDQLLNKIENKKRIINLQSTDKANAECQLQIQKLKQSFNEKANYLRTKNLYNTNYKPFVDGDNSSTAFLEIGHYGLDCYFTNTMERYVLSHKSTQFYELSFRLYRNFNKGDKRFEDDGKIYKFYFSDSQIGWAEKYTNGHIWEKDVQILFMHNIKQNEYYDLKNPVLSEDLVDYWFQALLTLSSKDMNQYL